MYWVWTVCDCDISEYLQCMRGGALGGRAWGLVSHTLESFISVGESKFRGFHKKDMFIDLYIHWLVHSWTRTFIDSYIHGLVHSLTRTSMDSYIHWLVHSWTRTFMDSYIHGLVHSLTRTFIDSYIHWLHFCDPLWI